jgi:AraC-like DNA-binding protein
MALLPPLTKVTSLAAFADTLRALGAPVESALERAKLPLSYAERPEAWVSYRALREFVADVSDREGLGDLGARAARASSQEGIHSSLRVAVYSASTLFHALCVLSRAARYQVTGLHIWIESEGGYLRLCHNHVLGPEWPGYEINESYRTYQLVAMLRRFLGPEWLPARILTASRESPQRAAPFADEGVPVLTHPNHGALDIPAHLAWRPILRPGPSGSSAALADPHESVSSVLRFCLAPYLLEGSQSLDLCAEIMCMSKRSLQRALSDERTSFNEVVSLARLDAALEDLKDPELLVGAIAVRLGYSEQSAFTRAFRGWMGLSPSAYRARLHAHPEDPAPSPAPH